MGHSHPTLRLPLPLLLATALLASCASPTTAPSRAADASSLRDLPAGQVVGHASESGAHAWRGIPFAKPPVGELRWRAPEPLPRWNGVREALESGAPCVQYPTPLLHEGPYDQPIGSEDCLTLNVFAPRFAQGEVPAAGERRPVMLWIHGGANLTGESGNYDWSHFAAKHDVVVVATNYRLGLFGWLRHPGLHDQRDDALDRSGNYGTLDLVRALEWVRDNAAAFGGDPHNVTIFGESAGGNNVIALLLSPPARGLFHRAISQSGGTWSASVAEAENWADDAVPGRPFSSRELMAKLRALEHPDESREARVAAIDAMSPNDLDAWMRGTSAYDLMALLADREAVTMTSVPLTIREGVVVEWGEMLESFERGSHAKVPTILGTNRDENRLFQMMNPEYTWKLFWLLPRIRDEERYLRDAEYASKSWKADGADEIAERIAAHGGSPVWGYRFDWDDLPSQLGTDFATMIGASHGIEIPFVMGNDSLGPLLSLLGGEETIEQRQPLVDAMGSYWANFARTGDPGRGESGRLPAWTPWNRSSESSPRFMIFDSEEDGALRMSADYLTAERIARELAADPRFDAGDDRCKALEYVDSKFPHYGAEDLSAAGC